MLNSYCEQLEEKIAKAKAYTGFQSHLMMCYLSIFSFRGSFPNAWPYEQGPSCSKCPSGYTCQRNQCVNKASSKPKTNPEIKNNEREKSSKDANSVGEKTTSTSGRLYTALNSLFPVFVAYTAYKPW